MFARHRPIVYSKSDANKVRQALTVTDILSQPLLPEA